MIRIGQLKIRTGHTKEELEKKIEHTLGVTKGDIQSIQIRKRSIDARKKPDIYYVYTIDVELVKVKKEKMILTRRRNKNLSEAREALYQFPNSGSILMEHRPVIVL